MKINFQPRSWTGIFPALGIVVILAYSSIAGPATATDTVAVSRNLQAAPQVGVASYYGPPYHGKLTASGEVFNMNDLTAAHPKLAFGTRVRVTHLGNNRSVIVRINDRGPFVQGRAIDLSKAAAAELQMLESGLARVKLEVLE